MKQATTAALLSAAESKVVELREEVAERLAGADADAFVIGNLNAKLVELGTEQTAIIEACGFEHDSDPDAPRTLVGYVRETQTLAVSMAEHYTAADADAAVRRVSTSSRHARAQLDRATKPLLFKDAPKDREFWAIVPMSWCERRETFQDRENDPWDEVLDDSCCPHTFFLGWVPAGEVKA